MRHLVMVIALVVASRAAVHAEACTASTSAEETAIDGRPVHEWIAERRSADPSRRQAAEKELQGHPRIALPALAMEKSGLPEPSHRAADEFVSALAKGQGGAVPSLLPLLSRDDWKLRETTIQILGWIGPAAETAAPSLVSALRDSAWGVRMQAAFALRSVGVSRPEVISALRALLGDETWIVANAASMALASSPSKTMPVLVEALGDANPRVRRFAAHALAEMAQPAEAALPQLLDMLRDDLPEVQLEVMGALTKLPPSELRGAVPILRHLLDSPTLRCVAARLLARKGEQQAVAALSTLIALMKSPFGIDSCADGAYGDVSAVGPAAVPALVRLLDHPATWTRRNAVIALQRIEPQTPESLQAIAGVLADDSLGDNAQQSLGEIGANAVEVLTGELSSDVAVARRRSAFALGRIGPAATAAVPTLLERLSVESGETKGAMIYALGRIGGERSKEAVPELRRTLADQALRRAAAGALARIAGPAAADVVPFLVEALREQVKDACPQPGADEELRAIGAPALPTLVGLLADESFPSKLAVLGLTDALGSEALEAARPILLRWVETDRSPWALDAAERLQRLDGTASPRLVEIFANATENTNPWSRLRGAEGLVRASADELLAKPILLELREHPFEAIRLRAEAALQRMNSSVPPASQLSR